MISGNSVLAETSPRSKKTDLEFEKPVQRLRATVEPFSHIAILPDRARGSTNEVTHPLKDVAPFSLKEQVGYSRLALVTDRSPFPPSPPSATTSYSVPTLPPVLRSGLLKEDATADAACSKLPLECHSKSTQLSCQSKAPDPYYLSHRRITEITNVNQVNSVPVSCETTAANEVEVPKDSSLEEKKEELESRIQVQADVNKELKRLLVASIGSDLQQRVSQVAQERAVAEHRLNTSLQHITESEEELDRLAIECDVWRSKFLASRLMIDELVSWKADVVRKLRESQRALQQLLQEQLEVKRILQASGCLDAGDQRCPAAAATTADTRHTAPQGRSILDLAREMVQRHKMVRNCALPGSHRARDVSEVEEMIPTTGELLAVQVLSNGGQPCNVYSSQSLPLPLKLSRDQLQAASPAVSQSSIHYILGAETHTIQFHCNRCKGKIHQI